MSAPLVISATLLGLAAAVSALQKVTRDPATLAALYAVGVRDTQMVLLAVLESSGALGLLVGIWIAPLGLAAAVGLALFYLAAVGAHVRVRDPFGESVPALTLLAVAGVTIAFEFAR